MNQDQTTSATTKETEATKTSFVDDKAVHKTQNIHIDESHQMKDADLFNYDRNKDEEDSTKDHPCRGATVSEPTSDLYSKIPMFVPDFHDLYRDCDAERSEMEMNRKSKKYCVVCKLETRKRCRSCKSVYYCSVAHQRQHREEHDIWCSDSRIK
jgi:hypothetical protein